MKILDIGSGTDKRVYQFYSKKNSVTHLDKKLGFDIEKDSLPEDSWNIIFCNHIIEHLENVDMFLMGCKRIMNKNTVLEIATPNLCAWFNRLVFLFGYLPHSYELSRIINVGKISSWSGEPLGGHVRVFSLRSMLELLDFYGFEVISVVGERSTYNCNFLLKWIDGLMTLNPNLASAFRIKCKLRS